MLNIRGLVLTCACTVFLSAVVQSAGPLAAFTEQIIQDVTAVDIAKGLNVT